jgi:hypothetical protein
MLSFERIIVVIIERLLFGDAELFVGLSLVGDVGMLHFLWPVDCF